MIPLQRLLTKLNNSEASFYVEKNHFWNEGLNIQESVGEHIARLKMSPEEGMQCMEAGAIWYLRYYLEHKNGYIEIWSSTFEKAIEGLLQELEQHENH